MSVAGCLLTDSDLFILFEESSQIPLKISAFSILLTFIYLVELNPLVNNQLNSSLWPIIVTHEFWIVTTEKLSKNGVVFQMLRTRSIYYRFLY